MEIPDNVVKNIQDSTKRKSRFGLTHGGWICLSCDHINRIGTGRTCDMCGEKRTPINKKIIN